MLIRSYESALKAGIRAFRPDLPLRSDGAYGWQRRSRSLPELSRPEPRKTGGPEDRKAGMPPAHKRRGPEDRKTGNTEEGSPLR